MKYFKIFSIIVLLILLGLSFSFNTKIREQYSLSILQRQLNLEQWNISMVYGDVEKDFVASIDIDSTYYKAVITVDKNLGRPLSRHELTHELIHIYVNEIYTYVVNKYEIKSQKELDDLHYYNERLTEAFTKVYTK